MRTRTWERCARGVTLAIALCALTAGSAAADSIPYFNGPGRIGFDNDDLGIPLEFDVAGQQSLAGLSFRQGISSVRFRNGAFTIRLAVTVDNRTGRQLEDLLLLVAALAQPLFVAPSTPIALDLGGGSLTPLSIAHLDASGGAPERFFAGFEVGTLANNRTFRAQLEYTVLGNLVGGRPPTLSFTIGAQPTIIPEPASALLVGLGLGALGARRRA